MSMMSYVWSCVDQKNVRLRWFFAIIPSLLFLGWGGLTAIEDSLIVFHSSTTSMSSGLFKGCLSMIMIIIYTYLQTQQTEEYKCECVITMREKVFSWIPIPLPHYILILILHLVLCHFFLDRHVVLPHRVLSHLFVPC